MICGCHEPENYLFFQVFLICIASKNKNPPTEKIIKKITITKLLVFICMLSLRIVITKSDGTNNITKQENIKYTLHNVRCLLVPDED
jgi:hypothetical protein